MLGREQASLQIAGETVRPVGRLLEHTDALARRVFHPPVVVDVTEQEITTLFPPHRPLGRPEIAAEARGKLLDRLRGRDDLVELGRELLDLPRRCLREGAASKRKSASRTGSLQKMST